MTLEIEYKFRVKGTNWQEQVTASQALEQGYLAYAPHEVRVRVVDGATAFLTVKGPKSADGSTREEHEQTIPVSAARALLDRSLAVIKKVRYTIPSEEGTWEVDVYSGALAGMVTAEIELPSADTPFIRPGWLGEDVTKDKAYGNGQLAQQGLPSAELALRSAELTDPSARRPARPR